MLGTMVLGFYFCFGGPIEKNDDFRKFELEDETTPFSHPFNDDSRAIIKFYFYLYNYKVRVSNIKKPTNEYYRAVEHEIERCGLPALGLVWFKIYKYFFLTFICK